MGFKELAEWHLNERANATMSEINIPEATETETVETVEVETTEPTLEELKAQVEHWKSFSRTHEKTAKENADAAKKLRDIEDADKSELTKALERVAELETELNSSSQKVLRASIISEFKLDADKVGALLTATDEVGLRAQAEALAEFTKTTSKVRVDNTDLEGAPDTNSNAALAKAMFG